MQPVTTIYMNRADATYPDAFATTVSKIFARTKDQAQVTVTREHIDDIWKHQELIDKPAFADLEMEESTLNAIRTCQDALLHENDAAAAAAKGA